MSIDLCPEKHPLEINYFKIFPVQNIWSRVILHTFTWKENTMHLNHAHTFASFMQSATSCKKKLPLLLQWPLIFDIISEAINCTFCKMYPCYQTDRCFSMRFFHDCFILQIDSLFSDIWEGVGDNLIANKKRLLLSSVFLGRVTMKLQRPCEIIMHCQWNWFFRYFFKFVFLTKLPLSAGNDVFSYLWIVHVKYENITKIPGLISNFHCNVFISYLHHKWSLLNLNINKNTYQHGVALLEFACIWYHVSI